MCKSGPCIVYWNFQFNLPLELRSRTRRSCVSKKRQHDKVEINRQLSDVPSSTSSDCFCKMQKSCINSTNSSQQSLIRANGLTAALWSSLLEKINYFGSLISVLYWLPCHCFDYPGPIIHKRSHWNENRQKLLQSCITPKNTHIDNYKNKKKPKTSTELVGRLKTLLDNFRSCAWPVW